MILYMVYFTFWSTRQQCAVSQPAYSLSDVWFSLGPTTYS